MFTYHNDTLAFNDAALRQVKQNAQWYLLLGIGLVVLGVLAVGCSWASTLATVVFLGATIFSIGIFEGIQALKMNRWSGFFLHLFLSIVYLIAGFFMITNPAVNAFTLTLLLAFSFIIAGIMRIIFSLSRDLPHKPWLFLNGLLTLALGGLVLYQWPVSGLWVLGTFMGIDAIFTGWTWIMLSLQAKKLTAKMQQMGGNERTPYS
jgi:uncharacterized membrane protein HdeD (DUF308 family)